MSGERRGEWHEWPFEPLPVLRALGTTGVEYVLIGGLAAVLQGLPLPTYDIDIAPAPETANSGRLEAALAQIDAIALTDAESVERAFCEKVDLSFHTPFGHIDVHHQPAGFKSYASLRRNALLLELEPGLAVLVSPPRDIILSRAAAGDQRQRSALEALLELG